MLSRHQTSPLSIKRRALSHAQFLDSSSKTRTQGISSPTDPRDGFLDLVYVAHGPSHQDFLRDASGRKKILSSSKRAPGLLLLIKKKEKKALRCDIHSQQRQKVSPYHIKGLLDRFLEILKGQKESPGPCFFSRTAGVPYPLEMR